MSAEPNGAPPSVQAPLTGEILVTQSQVSVGLAPDGRTLLIINPQDTGLNIVVLMDKAGASQIGKALVQQGSGIVLPP